VSLADAHSPALRIGVFGGAFDPPHRAHVALAQAALQQLQLDTLLVIPTGFAWHKSRTLTAASHRIAMCKLAFADLVIAQVDERETRRSGPTYTADTLQELKAENPGARLYLLIGQDQAVALRTWHRLDEVVRDATICVAARADFNASGSPNGPETLAIPDLRVLQMPPIPMSATEVRHQAEQHHDLVPLVFDSVARYIDQYHLYQPD
jgi:nicotinate-nucleotide adenylyltransferase